MNKKIPLSLLVMSSLLLGAGTATSSEVNLRYAHFMPPASWQHEVMFEDWGRTVEKESDGRISVRVYPAQTLGRAPAGYDNARTGITDLAWTVQGYTANRFPLSQIVELPGLFDNATEGSCAFQKLYDSGALDKEYDETHVLYVHVHGPGHIHTRDRPVTSLEDLEGLKIRQPTAVIGRLLSELGAEPVGMPAPQIYESTERGVIDGFLLPWEAVKGFRADEVVSHHTELGLYSLAFVTTMNKRAYERLPDDLRAVVDSNSGMKWAMIAGRGYDQGDIDGKETGEKSGTTYQLNAEEREQWEAAGERVTEGYLAELEADGLPGREVYEAFKGYVDECRVDLARN
ncbi:MAG: TRAP transporter substrate-binding protein [Aquisalimonadaceae bacterium]